MMLSRRGYFSTFKSKILGNNFILFVMFEYKKAGVMINSATANQMESTACNWWFCLSGVGFVTRRAGARSSVQMPPPSPCGDIALANCRLGGNVGPADG